MSSQLVTLAETQDLVQATLTDFFMSHQTAAHHIDPSYEQLWQTIWELSRAGGKRLRPHITLLTYQVLSDNDPQSIVQVAAAQELLHLALLIHDDIIDRDHVRYGTDNIAGRYNTIYTPFVENTAERAHFSTSAALLAGDLMISGAYEMIHTSGLAPQAIIEIDHILTKAIFEVGGGELMDTESTFRRLASVDAIKIATYKTALYSFVTPVLLGARLADVDHSTQKMLKIYAENLGIAYQLVDDILGVFGDTAITGKSAISDLKEGKRTYLVETFLKIGSKADIHTFQSLFGNNELTEPQAATLRELLVRSGAQSQTLATIDQYAQKAGDALTMIDLSDEKRSSFQAIINQAITRIK